jgi:hypothetical protein
VFEVSKQSNDTVVPTKTGYILVHFQFQDAKPAMTALNEIVAQNSFPGR